MKHLYEKSKLLFTLIWIGAYVVSFSIADKLSSAIGAEKIITAPLGIAFMLFMIVFSVKNGLTEEYGLCKFKGDLKSVLFFIPVIPILGLYLWNGVAWDGTRGEAVLCAVSMLCVGFIEEMLFRGFLFKTLCEDNVKVAVLVSSLTFGLGHIVNLLNGRDFLPTALQVCYATALGFMLTTLFCRGKSLLPGAVIHSILNVISVFHVSGTKTQRMISSAILCVLSVAYALWMRKNTEQKKGQANER